MRQHWVQPVYNFKRVYNAEGYAENPGSPKYYYYRKDHLGSNREVWQAPPSGGGGAGTTVQRTQYYPSGLPWAEGLGADVQNKKYNGKEFVEMSGLDEYDSQARWFYPAGDFTTTMDPLAEKYYSISPYAWCGNNSVNAIDLHGDSLTYTSQTNGVAQKAIDAHNTELSGYYDFSMDKNGVVSMTVIKGADLSKMTPEQKAYAGIMDKVVNGTDGMTKIEVVENSTNVLIGDAKLQTIDIGDINKLPNGSLSPISAESAHLHEVFEQYQLQVKLSKLNPVNPVGDAHYKATAVENILFGTPIDPYRYLNPLNSSTPTTGTMVVSPITATIKATLHILNNNITSVSYHP